MNPMMISILFFLSSLFITSLSSKPFPAKPSSAHITVMGFVYCDICSNNTFSKHSYFLPDAEVRIECKFKASYPRTKEQIMFSVNRTTNRHGAYKLEIPSVDGISCTEAEMANFCEASLINSSAKSCNVPGYKSTTDEISIKVKQENLCFYSLNALNFRPSKVDHSLCKK